MKARAVLASFALVLAAVLPAAAQQVRLEATPAERPEFETRIIPPPMQKETSRPPDADYYPQGTSVGHDPAFIEPFARSYRTPGGSGRYGVAGWTAPNQPVAAAAAGYRDDTGWLAIGFSVTWGGPPAPAPSRRQPR